MAWPENNQCSYLVNDSLLPSAGLFRTGVSFTLPGPVPDGNTPMAATDPAESGTNLRFVVCYPQSNDLIDERLVGVAGAPANNDISS